MKNLFSAYSRHVILFLVIALSINNAFGQLWQEVRERDIAERSSRYIQPTDYRAFKLDLDRMRAALENAPAERSTYEDDASVQIDLPLPDGSFLEIVVEESPIWEDGYGDLFPDMMTYIGYSLDEPGTYVRFDMTIQGFHAMIMRAGKSTVFIDPFTHNTSDKEHYLVYDRAHFVTNKVFSCGVESFSDAKPNSVSPVQRVPFTDCERKEYRLALAATGEYTAFHGGTVAGAAAAQVTSMNRVNGVYEMDLGIRMNIVANNNLIIYTNGATDPYDNGNGGVMLGQNQANCDAVIGFTNYDIGHVYSTGGGGVASLQSPCTANKARGVTGQGAPVGDPFDIDYVAHEMGHQFGGNHTQNNACNRSSASVECGSGSSIMGYAGICAPNVQSNSDDHFNGWNLVEMGNFINGVGGTCAAVTDLTGINSRPIISSATNGYVLPVSTPFALTAVAVDAEGDPMTYCWEQQDPAVATQPPVSSNTGGPTFRSISPLTSPTRYLPNLTDLHAGVSPTWEVLPGVTRNMNWKVTVRDNAMPTGCADYQNISISFNAAAGPFVIQVPSATGISWPGFTNQNITWSVAGTNVAPVNSAVVDILLSLDGGLTYPTILASGVANDGSHPISVPNSPSATCRIMVRSADNIFFDVSNNNFAIVSGLTDDFTISSASSTASICSPANAVFGIQVNQIGTFTDPVTLSSTALPGSAIGTFSSNPVNTPGTTDFIISNTASISPGSYPITITGVSTAPTLAKTVDLTLIVSETPSGPVTLLVPANSATSVAIPTDFSWTSLGGNGQSYDIDIALDAGFNTIIDNGTGLSTNAYTSPGLLGNTQYYWRVRGSNACGTVGNSATFSFTTSSCVVFASTDVPKTISATGTPTVTSTLTIASAGTVQDIDIRNLIGTHSWVSDLTIRLTSPLGTVSTLFSGICGNNDNFDLEFDDAAAAGAIPCPPTTGLEYQPSQALSAFNGESVTGVWTLTIVDGAGGDGGALSSWALDICLGAPATCLQPSALTAGSITPSGAELSWTENGSATLWNIDIGATPFTPDQNPEHTGVTNPFTWVAGSPSTEYQYYVQADCGIINGTSNWSGPYTFTTSSVPPPPINGVTCGSGNQSAYIFTEEFNAIGAWTGNISAASNGTWEIPGLAESTGTGPDAAYNGANYANFESSGNSSATANMISPAIDLTTALDEVELSFYFYAYGADIGTFSVGIGTSPTGPFTNLFTSIGPIQTAGNQAWTPVGLDLSTYIGSTVYVRFQQVATGTGFEGDLAVDFVRIQVCEDIPDCPDPTAGSASAVTATSAQLNWTEGGTATMWDVEYGNSGFSQGTGTAINGTTSNPLAIASLTSNTSYEFYVRAICGGSNGNSTWSGPYSFTTPRDYCGPDSFVDSGGLSGNYANNENVTTTVICPDTPGDVVTVTFNLVDIEVNATGTGSQAGCWDYLTIYDGDNTSAPVLAATLCGEQSGDGGTPSVASSLLSINDSFTSTNPNGCLTFTFFSDGSQVEQGWEATVNCATVTCPQPFAGTTSNVTIDSADLEWTEAGTSTSWAIEWGADGFIQGSGFLVASTSANPYSLTGLTDNTDYDFYVRSICGIGDTSAWSGPFSFATLIGSNTPCVGGFAGIYPCDNYDLQGHLTLAEMGATGGVEGNDIWGWTDPLDNKEYAIFGMTNGTSFVDISDPLNPRYLGRLPTHSSANIWRDMKVYNNYAFIVADNVGSHGMQVFDLTLLRNVTTPQTFSNSAHYSGVGSAHNIVINEATGYAYIVGSNQNSGGLHFVNIQNPLAPVIGGPGFSDDGYTHDAQVVIYNGPDVAYQGKEIAFASNEDTFTIIDVDDKSDAQQISRTGYAGSSYAHQGWLTEDHQYFLMNDELDEQNNAHNTRTYIWNIQDLDAPVFMGYYQSAVAAIDHNNYVKGDSLYQANYRGGLRVLDISDVANANLSEVGFFDVYPASNSAQFNGAWSNYPYFASGNIIISSIEDGLFIVKATPPLPCSVDAITNGGNQTACNPSTNTYSNDVTVTYANAPASGNLVVNGQPFAIGTSPQTVTLVGLVADGNAVNVTASFSTDGGCTATVNSLFTAPVSCVCSIDAIANGGNQTACVPASNTYSNDVTVTYTNAPATGNLVVNGQTFAIGSSPQTVTLTNLTSDGNAVNVTASFSVDAGCTLTSNGVFTAPASCSTLGNDVCAGAVSLTPSLFGYNMWDTVSVAGTSQSLPGCIGNADDDTWYSWVAQSSNDVVIVQDIGASSDMVIEIFDGCGGNSLGCLDNYGTGQLERAWVGGLTVGNTYYFRTYDKASGGPLSGQVRIMVKTFALGGIRDIYCGNTNYEMSSWFTPERQDLNQLYPYTAVSASGYQVQLTDQATSNVFVKTKIGYQSQYFQFNNFVGLPFNAMFDAQAKHAVNVPANGTVITLWSEYGPACTMGVGGVSQSSLRPQYCEGSQDFGLGDQVLANYVPNATAYRFIFNDGVSTHVRTKSSYSLFLYDVPGLEYGRTYAVTVQVQVNGQWSLPGTVCNINMLSQPPSTALRAQYCNGTYLYPHGNYFLAEMVFGADQYQWRFTPTLGGTSLTDYTGTLSFAFHITSIQFISGTSYNVEVRARVQGMWGDYAEICPITIQANPGISSGELSDSKRILQKSQGLNLYPNPNDGQEVMIQLSNLSEVQDQAQVEVIDITGRVIQTNNIAVKGESIKYKLRFDHRLLTGVYFLKVTRNGFTLTERLVIE